MSVFKLPLGRAVFLAHVFGPGEMPYESDPSHTVNSTRVVGEDVIAVTALLNSVRMNTLTVPTDLGTAF